MRNQTTCNQCHKKFNIKLKTKTHGISIKESYFVCPHCKTKYIAFILDAECRRMQNKINKLRGNKNNPAQLFIQNKISEQEYKKQIDLIDDQIKRVQSVLQVKMDSLKQTYTG